MIHCQKHMVSTVTLSYACTSIALAVAFQPLFVVNYINILIVDLPMFKFPVICGLA